VKSPLCTLVGRLLALLLLTLAMAGLLAQRAHAEGEIAESYQVSGSVRADGTLMMTETITFSDAAPDTLIQRIARIEEGMDFTRYRFQISDVAATIAGEPVPVKTSRDGDHTVLTLNTHGAGSRPIAISYSVVGAARATPQVEGRPASTRVVWRVLQGLSVPVKQARGSIEIPGTITSIACQSGPPAAQTPCATWAGGTHQAPDPQFTDRARGAGESITLEFTVPSQMVASNQDLVQRWTLGRAFSIAPVPLLAALILLLSGGAALWLLHRTLGRDHDHAGRVIPVAEFTPVAAGAVSFTVLEDVRPGHVGTVADERVDPVDITATLLDLAVRGHLRIHELPATGAHKPMDWRFERLDRSTEELRAYELLLLDAVAPADGSQVKVSSIETAVAPIVPAVQDSLYSDVVQQGWYERRPDDTRSIWITLAGAAVALALVGAGLLVGLTNFGLFGLALIVIALGGLFVAQEMPRRTAKGAGLLNGLHSLAAQLETQPTDSLSKQTEYEELSSVLPYAVVLGGRDRWLAAIAAADDDPEVPDPTDLTWYHADDDWHLADLPDAVRAFLVAVSGELYTR